MGNGASPWTTVSARMLPTFLSASVYDLTRRQLYNAIVIKKREREREKKEEQSTIRRSMTFSRSMAYRRKFASIRNRSRRRETLRKFSFF